MQTHFIQFIITIIIVLIICNSKFARDAGENFCKWVDEEVDYITGN